jgi:hypothetical protein
MRQWCWSAVVGMMASQSQQPPPALQGNLRIATHHPTASCNAGACRQPCRVGLMAGVLQRSERPRRDASILLRHNSPPACPRVDSSTGGRWQ